MKLEELIADPVYQMNLCLWMLAPSAEAGVRPVLKEAGFQLRSIEPPLPMPLEIRNVLADNQIRISDPASPDLILHDGQRGFVMLECKASLFGSEPKGSDSPQRQARALLLQVPEILADALAVDRNQIDTSHLVYLSRALPLDPGGSSQTAGLQEIADSLESQELRVAPFGMLGLLIGDRKISISGGYSPGSLPASMVAVIPDAGVAVQELEPDTDPRPLYFIPWMPGSENSRDSRGQEIFGNRVLQATAARIGQCRPPAELNLSLDDLLNEATWSSFERWRNKDAAKSLRKNARKLIGETFKSASSGADLTVEPGTYLLRMKIPDIDAKERLLEAFRKWESTLWNQPNPQGDLFDTPSEDENR